MRPPHGGRIWASQGGLSRNKVAVGESAAGSPPNVRDHPHQGGPPPSVSDGHQEVSSTTSTTSVVGHLRTARVNEIPPRPGRWAHSSVVECLLCKEDALGSNPSGSISGRGREPCPLSGRRGNVQVRRPMHYTVKARVGRVRRTLPLPPGRGDDDRMYVQSRRPLDPFTRVTVTLSTTTWLLYRLVDGSARVPKTDVPSCDKPMGAARRRRT